MNKLTSIYLDILRIIAALCVFFHHCNFSWFSNGYFFNEEKGHKFVVVFFVLSGFLIAYSGEKKNQTFKTYIIDRVSRLYSVIIPALILTYLLDTIGKLYNPSLYHYLSPEGNQLFRATSCLLFLNQIYSFCIKPSCNIPFWSIGYEFWYYLLFGIYIFINNKPLKYSLLIAGLMLMGLKMVLLFPIWLYGVFVFYVSKNLKINQIFSWVLFITSFILIIIFTFFLQAESNQWISITLNMKINLYFSAYYTFDLVYGLVVALNIFAISTLHSFTFNLPKTERLVKKISASTFSLYLYHFPILAFVASAISYDKNNIYQVALVILGVLLSIYILSIFTEVKRDAYKKNIIFVTNRIEIFVKKIRLSLLYRF